MFNLNSKTFKARLFLFSLICGVNFTANAQNADSTVLKNSTPDYFVVQTKGVKLSLLFPAVTFQYEHPIGPKTIFDANVGMAVGIGFSKGSASVNGNVGYQFKSNSYSFMPAAFIAVKHYYNIEKRFNKGKNISNNSASYLGGRLFGFMHGWYKEKQDVNGEITKFNQFSTSSSFCLVAIWGMNRQLGKNFGFNLETGPSAKYHPNEKIAMGIWLLTGFSKSF